MLTAVADIAGSALYRAQVMETLEERVAWRTKELARANEQLKELDRLKSKFVSDISHELRTPMANLRLYADLLAKGSPEKRERYLSVLQAETLRLIDVVEPILSYSQIGFSLIDVAAAPISLNDLVRSVVGEHQHAAQKREIELGLEMLPDLPAVCGEPAALRQLVTNLLTNALTYSHQGTVHIRTQLAESGSMVLLTVEDQGIGIPAEDLPHVFDWFYRGQRAGQSNIPGSGLGLALVRATAEHFGGRTEVESVVGQGSTFRVWLPVCSAEVLAQG